MTALPKTSRRPAPKRLRTLLLLSWPAWTAWALALVFLWRPIPVGDLAAIYLAVLVALYLSGLAALGFAIVALAFPVRPALRLVACAMNLSVLLLGNLHGLSYRALWAGEGNRIIATTKCRDYCDAVRTWSVLTGKRPDTLTDMERPLHPGEEPFVVVDKDPWGSVYTLHRDGDRIEVRSRGPDRGEGTADDIAWPPAD